MSAAGASGGPSAQAGGPAVGRAAVLGPPGPVDRLERELRRMALLQRRAVLARLRRRRGSRLALPGT